MKPHDRPFAAVAKLALLVAWASAPPPDQEIAAAERAVQAAHASTANDLASEQLATAGQKLDEAMAARAAGQHEQARRLAEQALVDAELAGAEARAAAAQRRAAALRNSLHDLDGQAARALTGS